MKGIILAGGSGTRLYPLTKVTSKQLLPVYDKPMIFYPLSTLMLAGIKDILVISTRQDLPNIERLLGDGSRYGISLSYRIQEEPKGIAQALLIGEDFIENQPCALILGDNIFYGNGFSRLLKKAVAAAENGSATIFGYYVNEPNRFGIVEFDDKGRVASIEEKPQNPKSNYCVTGLYFYDEQAVKYAKQLKPSERKELEITDLNRLYLQNKGLELELLGRGFAWMDAGTVDSLAEASDFIRIIQKRQSIEISAPEEIAFINGWISKEELLRAASECESSVYGEHLKRVYEGRISY